MGIDRRKFLKSTGVLALAGLTSGLSFGEQAQQKQPAQPRKLRIGVFSEADFPTGDVQPIGLESIERASKEFEIIRFTRAEADATLKKSAIDVYLHPYGSAFPLDCFDVIDTYLKSGGKWVNAGGMPLSIPVVFESGAWKRLEPEPGFYKRIGITAGHFVETAGIVPLYAKINSPAVEAEISSAEAPFDAKGVYELQMPLTRSKSHPNEDGSDGPREILMEPRIVGYDYSGIRRVAPWVVLNHVNGLYKGGMWSFTTVRGAISAELVMAQIQDIGKNIARLEVTPKLARLIPSEAPVFMTSLYAPGWGREPNANISGSLKVHDEQGTVITESDSLEFAGVNTDGVPFECRPHKLALPVKQGLYLVELEIVSSVGTATATTGFWIASGPLKLSADPISVNESGFVRDSKPYPVCGTTYMSSTTHRRFLLEPTPDVWDRDFRSLQSAGINMVRTGIWTGWREHSDTNGTATEETLRSLESYVLTAHKYDIPVIFTFFAFLPETWQNDPTKTNSFFDPAAIESQKRFISSIVSRFAGVTNVIWDFINEPSFSSPTQLWNCRPNYDAFENAAWVAWLLKRYGAKSEEKLKSVLSAVYNLPASSALELPPLDHFADVNVVGTNTHARVVDYRLFAQDSFSAWTNMMVETVRSSGGTNQLVTVGQDEGATADRPSPHFFGTHLDFTSVHNWWYNNDLVWDNVMTGVAGKPNLIEETGVMYYERADGFPLRTEQDVANLLERKIAIAFGAGGAGFIEWIWNTNPYMPSDNEAAIGLFRNDGTAKPEYDVVRAFARFFSENSLLMQRKRPADVAMLIPHSNLYSPRNTADEATRRCVKALVYDMHYSVQGISEYDFFADKVQQKHVFLPAPGILSERCWQELLKFVSNGGILVCSGPFEMDEHFHGIDRMSKIIKANISHEPVSGSELVILPDGRDIALTFGAEKINRIARAAVKVNGVRVPTDHQASSTQFGSGTIVWAPVPVESSDGQDAVALYYRWALLQAKIIGTERSVSTNNTNVLTLVTGFEHATLVIFVNESDTMHTVPFQYKLSDTQNYATIKPGKTALCLMNKSDGKILASMGHIS